MSSGSRNTLNSPPNLRANSGLGFMERSKPRCAGRSDCLAIQNLKVHCHFLANVKMLSVLPARDNFSDLMNRPTTRRSNAVKHVVNCTPSEATPRRAFQELTGADENATPLSISGAAGDDGGDDTRRKNRRSKDLAFVQPCPDDKENLDPVLFSWI
jgi:hypothetical protein